ncbi:hypothetical protein J2W42_003496 [Rhizobium tibeticum]|nr:hypothetical protein [Rhizobium tibeticum]
MMGECLEKVAHVLAESVCRSRSAMPDFGVASAFVSLIA